MLQNINFIKPSFNYQEVEKNWVYFDSHGKLQIIYKWYPLQICEIDENNKNLNLIKEIDMPPFFKNARGSTCGLHYNDEIWFISHFNLNGYYSHFFVVFDKNMNLKKFSENFYFEGYKIEFCIGFCVDDNENFIIPYSINDSNTTIGIYDRSTINNLKWRYITN
jgi:hypothetical protein